MVRDYREQGTRDWNRVLWCCFCVGFFSFQSPVATEELLLFLAQRTSYLHSITPLLTMTPLLPVICFILLSSSNLAHASSPPSPTHHSGPIDVVIGVDGGTESIRACCFDARSGHIRKSLKVLIVLSLRSKTHNTFLSSW